MSKSHKLSPSSWRKGLSNNCSSDNSITGPKDGSQDSLVQNRDGISLDENIAGVEKGFHYGCILKAKIHRISNGSPTEWGGEWG